MDDLTDLERTHLLAALGQIEPSMNTMFVGPPLDDARRGRLALARTLLGTLRARDGDPADCTDAAFDELLRAVAAFDGSGTLTAKLRNTRARTR